MSALNQQGVKLKEILIKQQLACCFIFQGDKVWEAIWTPQFLKGTAYMVFLVQMKETGNLTQIFLDC